MGFLFYDIIFLILFCIGVAAFLYKNKKRVEIESKIIFLYKTKLGLDKIEAIRNKYHKSLRFVETSVVILGYLMMAFSIFIIITSKLIGFVIGNLIQIVPGFPSPVCFYGCFNDLIRV